MVPYEKDDSYRTIAREVKAEINVKGSRFIAYIRHVATETEVQLYLRSLKEQFHDATHHCYAFVIHGSGGDIARFSDAGEPAGTAGKPILATLQGNHLSNVICVVVRYFGGTKLGVGGLARAYAESVKTTLKTGEIIIHHVTGTLNISFPYEVTGAVERLVSECNASVIHREFSETGNLTCSIRKSVIEKFIEKFRDITRGKGKVNNQ